MFKLVMHKLMIYIIEIRLLIDESQCNGTEIIYNSEEIEKIQLSYLNIVFAKAEDVLVVIKDPLQEVNQSTYENIRVILIIFYPLI